MLILILKVVNFTQLDFLVIEILGGISISDLRFKLFCLSFLIKYDTKEEAPIF